MGAPQPRLGRAHRSSGGQLGRPTDHGLHPPRRPRAKHRPVRAVPGSGGEVRHELGWSGAMGRYLGRGPRPAHPRRCRALQRDVRDADRHHGASRARGAAPDAGVPRRPDRAREPRAVHGPGGARPHASSHRSGASSGCCSSTSTGSRPSTTASATRSATSSSSRSASASTPRCDPRTRSPGWVATSSPSSSRR